MPVKRFYASTLPEALRAVKETFGDSALIVSSRELAPGEWRPRQADSRRAVEVVASDEALETAAPYPAASPKFAVTPFRRSSPSLSRAGGSAGRRRSARGGRPGRGGRRGR